MTLRICLVALVSALGITIPSRMELPLWYQSVEVWAKQAVASWETCDQSNTVAAKTRARSTVRVVVLEWAHKPGHPARLTSPSAVSTAFRTQSGPQRIPLALRLNSRQRRALSPRRLRPPASRRCSPSNQSRAFLSRSPSQKRSTGITWLHVITVARRLADSHHVRSAIDAIVARHQPEMPARMAKRDVRTLPPIRPAHRQRPSTVAVLFSENLDVALFAELINRSSLDENDSPLTDSIGGPPGSPALSIAPNAVARTEKKVVPPTASLARRVHLRQSQWITTHRLVTAQPAAMLHHSHALVCSPSAIQQASRQSSSSDLQTGATSAITSKRSQKVGSTDGVTIAFKATPSSASLTATPPANLYRASMTPSPLPDFPAVVFAPDRTTAQPHPIAARSLVGPAPAARAGSADTRVDHAVQLTRAALSAWLTILTDPTTVQMTAR